MRHHQSSAGGRMELPIRDVAGLIRVVGERGRAAASPSLSAAIDALVEKERTPEVGRPQGEVLADPSVPGRARGQAAINLRRLPAPVAEPVLLANLGMPDPTVQSAVLRSLSHVGGPDSLRALGDLPVFPAAFLNRQLAFAQQVISHREGAAAPPPPGADPRWTPHPRARMVEFAVSALPDRAAGEAVAGLAGEAYGIGLTGEFAATFSDPEVAAPVGLFFNDFLAGGRTWGALGQRPTILGVLTRAYPRTGAPSVWQVLLADPRAGGFAVRGYRSDGAQLLDGGGEVKRDGVQFSVISLDRPGQCRFMVSGRATAHGLSWDQHRSSPDRLRKRSTTVGR